MSAQVLIGSALAATAATLVFRQKDGHTVGHPTNTGSHLRWNLGNIRDGVYDDLVSFKHALIHTITFSKGNSRDRYGYGYGDRYSSLSRDVGRGRGGYSAFGEDQYASLDRGRTGGSGGVGGIGGLSGDRGYSGRSYGNEARSAIASSSAYARDQVQDMTQGVQNKVDDVKQAAPKLVHNAQEKIKQSFSDVKQTVSDVGKDASEKTHSLFNWGSGNAEKGKATAIGDYDVANKAYEHAVNMFNDSKKGIFSKGDEQLRRNVEAAKDHLEHARKNLEAASADFENYAKQSISDLSNRLDEQDRELRNRGFLSWFKSTPSSSSGSKNTNSWTECAEQAVKDTKNGISDTLSSNKLGPRDSQKRLDSLGTSDSGSWGFGKSDMSARERAEKLAADSARSLKGWGENASQFAEEELEEERKRANKLWKN
ncbi:HCL482Wp [Eremothecium sinecaudum]|uniref:HCL482Wp n=1 Tax=Eremothecium sinecaudum TaxID=45286 RepID=A0A120K1R7_9SACH|nr:HCL482Wp [Eremothecium sinecaudum]AMD19669.1 HCL482Wp [Eremothecium sinecaudum]